MGVKLAELPLEQIVTELSGDTGVGQEDAKRMVLAIKARYPMAFTPIQDRCLERIEPGEVWFLVRSRDLTAASVVDCWIGMNLPSLSAHNPKMVEAQAIAALMRMYPHRRLAD